MDNWTRVTRSDPCPICEKPDWCMVTGDSSAVMCMRIESDRKIEIAIGTAWIHQIGEQPTKKRRVVRKSPENGPTRDWAALSASYFDQGRNDRYTLSRLIGVSTFSLAALKCGWTGQCWTFPMLKSPGIVCGILRRFPDGAKLTVKGSKVGAFVPHRIVLSSPVVICEGPTDVAALLDMGIAGLGRQSCRCDMRPFASWLYDKDLDVVVLGENDQKNGLWPGRDGAIHCANQLSRIMDKPISAAMPPAGIKDVREWRREGAARKHLINDMEYIQ